MKGMIMGAESVGAILDGRKIQTRRVINPQPLEGSRWMGWLLDSTGREDSKRIGSACWRCDSIGRDLYAKPRYKVGEIVYVKEGWTTQYDGIHDDNGYGEYVYKADDAWLDVYDGCSNKWQSPLFMKEEASRIHLEITGIKVQMVQDISWDECIREGISDMVIPENLENQEMYRWLEKEAFPDSLAGIISKLKDAYASLWDSINAKKGFPLESNPWVFAYTFKVVQGC